jgi:hypothetical protein
MKSDMKKCIRYSLYRFLSVQYNVQDRPLPIYLIRKGAWKTGLRARLEKLKCTTRTTRHTPQLAYSLLPLIHLFNWYTKNAQNKIIRKKQNRTKQNYIQRGATTIDHIRIRNLPYVSSWSSFHRASAIDTFQKGTATHTAASHKTIKHYQQH